MFIIFGLTIIGTATGILVTKNVVHAAFFLVLCLVSIAGLYVLLNATFLAVVQLMVYAGGVLILLAFGIMLTNRPEKNGKLITEQHLFFWGILAAGLLFACLIYVNPGSTSTIQNTNEIDQIDFIGQSLMTSYILPFELIAYLLLVVLVGASYYAKKAHS